MLQAIDLPIRDGVAARSPAEPTPPEFQWPTFSYWLKAGFAFTLGAGGAYVVGIIVWLSLLRVLPALALLRLFRLI